MTCETFFEYVKNVFHPWLESNKIPLPVILFLDGHTSHLTYHLTEFCQQKQIELVALYPNATHVMQPMDVAVFHPMKSAWRKHVQKWRLENNGRKMKREEFSPLLQQVFKEMKKETIASGFSATGLKDLDPDKIKYNKLIQKSTTFGQTTATMEYKANEIRSHLNYVEGKIGKEKIRMFAAGNVRNPDESLFQLWQAINKDLADLVTAIERNKADKNRIANNEEAAEQDELETGRNENGNHDERVENRREDDFEEDVDGDLQEIEHFENVIENDGDEIENGSDVIKEIQDLLEIGSGINQPQPKCVSMVNNDNEVNEPDNAVIDGAIYLETISNEILFCGGENDVVELAVEGHSEPFENAFLPSQSENLPSCSKPFTTPEKNASLI